MSKYAALSSPPPAMGYGMSVSSFVLIDQLVYRLKLRTHARTHAHTHTHTHTHTHMRVRSQKSVLFCFRQVRRLKIK
jgi:hypothetical protein